MFVLTLPWTLFQSESRSAAERYDPRPLDIATVRAGSNVAFHWSHWLHSHKGPITAWLAPYEGDIADVNVNELEFFKIAEDAIDENGVWATDRLMDNAHTWSAVIPADIKSGKYVLRQEFWLRIRGVGPQFYMTCFNFEVLGDGNSQPAGMPFPGAYEKDAPGLWFDLTSDASYPPAGPPLYKSEYTVELEPNEFVILSPTNQGAEADAAYHEAQGRVLKFQEDTNTQIDVHGG
ncbi:unnamed protein product [Parascedosporium putredinis]|uniref:lytic cellulose monooxygenase (C4-dehydrogenating) n=1 Tax=Parascedosporium putredinis TaxID=1442378 RepID=A0A9P1H0A6_9PEZI|nr:unnamed protein product [Parascedosporium putredinis]CAI7992608.1 unnamed protein product [Parascedosporium putredinis]